MSRVREGSHNIVTVDFELRFSKTDTGKVSRKRPNALLTIQNRKYRLNEFNMPASNGPIFILVVAIADGAILEDPSIEWLLNPARLHERDTVMLRFKPDW